MHTRESESEMDVTPRTLLAPRLISGLSCLRVFTLLIVARACIAYRAMSTHILNFSISSFTAVLPSLAVVPVEAVGERHIPRRPLLHRGRRAQKVSTAPLFLSLSTSARL